MEFPPPVATRSGRPSRQPRVVAHRGASESEPEHTLAAYRAAIEAGADALECDVRLTADGHLVCVHDRTVNRTSDGRGLVSTLELTTLEGLDWGSWKLLAAGREPGPDAPDAVELGDRAHLLTLRRLLRLVRDCGRPVDLAIETKHPTRYGAHVEQTLVAVLAEFGLAGPPAPGAPSVRVMSFSVLALHRMRRLAPGLPLVLLMDRVAVAYRDGSLPRGVGVAGVGVRLLRSQPQLVSRFQRRGHQVHVWTVDRPEDVALCVEQGVDAIITNRPREVLRLLGRAPDGPERPGDATAH